METKKNILIEKYLEQHSLVESNIRSFDDFIQNKTQQIVMEINDGVSSDEEIEIKFGKVRIGKPNVIEADGSTTLITPMTARLRNITYSAPVFVELSVKYENQNDSTEVEIGRIPIIVKSSACNVAKMNKDELRA